MEENEQSKFLRTVLRKDVYARLETLAQEYSTGYGKWDFGVAIQRLLDFYEEHSTVAQINGKLDVLLSQAYALEQEQVQDEVKEEKGIEMLGGENIR